MESVTRWDLIANWLTAIGTNVAVLLALFGAVMKRWIFKPKLELSITTGFPHCLLIKRDNPKESDSDMDVIEICASVNNSKRYTAKNSRILIQSIFIPEADGVRFCEYTQFRAQPLRWMDLSPEKCDQEIDIAQSITYYVKIAEILKPQNEMTEKDSANQCERNERPVIAIAVKHLTAKRAYTQIPSEHKSTIIALQIVCSDSPAQLKHIRIDWRGDRVEDYKAPGKLKVQLLTDNEASKLLSKKVS